MVLTKRQKFEIEKFHQDPLPSRAEAVTKNALNFYRTVLMFTKYSDAVLCSAARRQALLA